MLPRRDAAQSSTEMHALIVEDDILVAAFIAGVLLDHGITGDSLTAEDCREYALRRRYHVAVVGIDRITSEFPMMVRLLERHRIVIVFFSLLGDPHGVAANFPQFDICHYDCQDSEMIAAQVWRAIRSSAENFQLDLRTGRSILQ